MFNKKYLNGGAINNFCFYKKQNIVKAIYADTTHLKFDFVERLDKETLFNLYNKVSGKFPKYLGQDNFEYIKGNVIKNNQLNKHNILSMAQEMAVIHSNKRNININQISIDKRINLFEEVFKYYKINSYVYDYCFKWLRDNKPSFTSVFIHGDYKLNNLKFKDNNVCGVFDLEFAKFSDASEDIAWLFSSLWGNGWNDNNQSIFIKEYEKQTGHKIDKNNLYYWNIFALVRFAVIAIQQYHNAIKRKDVELHITGWRLKSIEKELINLLKINCNYLNNNDFSYRYLYNFKLFLSFSIHSLFYSIIGKKSFLNTIKYIFHGLFIYGKKTEKT